MLVPVTLELASPHEHRQLLQLSGISCLPIWWATYEPDYQEQFLDQLGHSILCQDIVNIRVAYMPKLLFNDELPSLFSLVASSMFLLWFKLLIFAAAVSMWHWWYWHSKPRPFEDAIIQKAGIISASIQIHSCCNNLSKSEIKNIHIYEHSWTVTFIVLHSTFTSKSSGDTETSATHQVHVQIKVQSRVHISPPLLQKWIIQH